MTDNPVPPPQRSNTKPRDLERVGSGSVVDPAALGVLRKRLEGLQDRGTVPEEWLRLLLPALQSVGDLLPLAWDVLDGDPAATAHFRQILGGFGGAAEQTRAFGQVTALFEPEKGSPCRGLAAVSDPQSPAAKSHPLAPPERMVPLLAAAVVAARGPTDMARLVGALELGLRGLPELTRLYDAALALPDTKGRVPASMEWNMSMRAAFGRLGVGWLPLPGASGPGGSVPGGFGPGGFGPGGHPGTPGGVPVPGQGGIPDPWGPRDPIPAPGTPGAPAPQPGVPQDPARAISVFDAFELCLMELVPRMRASGQGIQFFLPDARNSYRIDSVTPEHACPDDTLVLTGAGFEGTEEVRFTRPGMRPIGVAPLTVEQTRITVLVPAEAVTGPVWLYIPERITLCHGMSVTMARPGTPGTFVAGRPRIAHLGVDAGACAVLGQPATLHWAVEPDDASVVLREIDDSGDREIFRGAGPTGSWRIDTSSLTTRTYRLVAANPHASCGSATASVSVEVRGPAPALQIVGVEVTQGIQRYVLPTPGMPEDPANNSLRMIAGKDTVVRVFVRSDRGGFNGDVARVTGMLRLRGRRYMPMNTSPFIDAGPSPLRENLDDSLNFLVPAAAANGLRQQLDIEVFSDDGCPSGAFARRRHVTDWLDLPPLPVTIRRIAEPATGDIVSEADALRIVRDAFDRLPSTAENIRVWPGQFTIEEGTTESNYCHDGGFYQLALSVAYEHNYSEGLSPDIHETVWIGIFFRTDCNAGGMMAWPWNSTCISQPTPVVAAHELAHCVGMGHTVTRAGESCEDAFQPVACHRLPRNGHVGQVVFDIRGNSVVTNARDLMSYMPQFRFPHPDHWEMIRDGIDDYIAAIGS